MNLVLWIVQVLLGALFIFAGAMKFVMPIEAMQDPIAFPGWFLRFIGAAELAGGIGLIVPSLLRIKPALTPLAAVGLVIIMIGATAIGVMTGPIVMASIPFAVGIAAAFVAYGRWRLVPLMERSAR